MEANPDQPSDMYAQPALSSTQSPAAFLCPYRATLKIANLPHHPHHALRYTRISSTSSHPYLALLGSRAGLTVTTFILKQAAREKEGLTLSKKHSVLTQLLKVRAGAAASEAMLMYAQQLLSAVM